MKRTKKILVTLLCAVLLVTGTVAVTVAYLTSTDSVTNTFTVGKVVITLDEDDVDDSTSSEPNARDEDNTYKIFPGGTYDKDPIVHVGSESEDCYVFVKVVKNLGTSEVAVDSVGTIENQMIANGWAKVSGEGVTSIWIYKGDKEEKESVAKDTNLPVFTKFAVSNSLTNDTLALLDNETIEVTAYAIQVDGFEDKTPSAIWGAAKFE